MGAFWAVMGPSWRPRGRSWGDLGVLLGRLEPSECREEANAQILQKLKGKSMIWAYSGPPGGPLGGLLGRVGPSWRLLGRTWRYLGLSWAVLEAILDHLGRTWRPSWTILEAMLGQRGHLGGHLSRPGGHLGPFGVGRPTTCRFNGSLFRVGGMGRSRLGSSFRKRTKTKN